MIDRAYRTAPRERFTGGQPRPPIESDGPPWWIAPMIIGGIMGWAAIAALIAGVMS